MLRPYQRLLVGTASIHAHNFRRHARHGAPAARIVSHDRDAVEDASEYRGIHINLVTKAREGKNNGCNV